MEYRESSTHNCEGAKGTTTIRNKHFNRITNVVSRVSWNAREKQLNRAEHTVSDRDECQIKRNYRRQKVSNCPLVVVQSIGQTSSADVFLFTVQNTKIRKLIFKQYFT